MAYVRLVYWDGVIPICWDCVRTQENYFVVTFTKQYSRANIIGVLCCVLPAPGYTHSRTTVVPDGLNTKIWCNLARLYLPTYQEIRANYANLVNTACTKSIHQYGNEKEFVR